MLRGSCHSIETRQRMSAKRRGKLNGFYGRHHSADTKERQRQVSLLLWQTPSYRKRTAEGLRRYHTKHAEA